VSTAETPTAPSARGGRRERTKAENRAAILRAARETFAESGYEASSIRDIIGRTELASGTFYNYFPDKESVLRALLEDRAEELRTRLSEARAGASDFDGFVRDAYRVYFAFLADDLALLALLRRNAGAVRALAGEPELAGGVDDLMGDLRAAIDSGHAPGFDAEYMAAAMAGAGFEIAVRMLERHPVDVEGAADFAASLFLGGVERLAASGAEAAAGEAGGPLRDGDPRRRASSPGRASAAGEGRVPSPGAGRSRGVQRGPRDARRG
jgi:AcrR family transcriptional regulator